MRLSAPIHRLKRAARDHARVEAIPLHAALDQVAAKEGFASWSLLAATATENTTKPDTLLASLKPGESVLISARPQQGKTMFALHLLLSAIASGREAHFFSLDYTPRDVAERLATLPANLKRHASALHIDCSDAISARHIMARLATAASGTVAAIDYLQLLDQKRAHPPLQNQVAALADFARERGVILAFLSQIDRTFDPDAAPLPGLADIRLPNPLDLKLFSRSVFLHGGRLTTIEPRH